MLVKSTNEVFFNSVYSTMYL